MKQMAGVGLVVVACAFSGFAAPAQAQRGGNIDMPTTNRNNPALSYHQGLEALRAEEYPMAEQRFREVLTLHPMDAPANMMMGLVMIGEENYPAARKYLRIAVDARSKLPDPKGRLGWVEAKLGDEPAALKQKTDLEKLADACKATCPEAKAIAEGIAMIDAGLANVGASFGN
jgi:predicted Zn-dependent protease